MEYKEILSYGCRRSLALSHFNRLFWGTQYGELHLTVDRYNLLDSSINFLTEAQPEDLRGGLEIEFKHEVAVGAGPVREWFSLIFKDIFVAELALTLMHQIQVGVMLDSILFKQLSGLEAELEVEDIKDTDPESYKSMKKLLVMDSDALDGLGLTFENLRDNGENIPVSTSNRIDYMNEYISHRFLRLTQARAAKISQGFQDVMPSQDCMRGFFSFINHEDLNYMLCGDLGDICIKDWRLHTKYVGYTDADDQIIWFWKYTTHSIRWKSVWRKPWNIIKCTLLFDI